MKKRVISMLTVMLLTISSYAGGKFVVPVVTPVIPIAPSVDPVSLYLGLGFVTAGLSRDCPCDNKGPRINDMTYGGLFMFGWSVNPYLNVEIRALKAELERDFSDTTHFGLFLKPQYPVTSNINLYGFAGVGQTVVDYSNERCMKGSRLTKNGLSYGAGLEYEFGILGLWIDYQHLLYNEGVFDAKSNIGAVGLSYHF